VRSRLSKYWRIGAWPYIRGLSLLASAATAFAISQDVPANFWRHYDDTTNTVGDRYWWAAVLLFCTVLVAGGGTFLAPVRVAARRLVEQIPYETALTERDKRERIVEALQVAFRRVADEQGTPEWTGLGIHGFFVDVDKLTLAGSMSFHARPGTDIVFKKGKGVVGRCWQSGCEESLNLGATAVEAAIRSVNSKAWKSLDTEIRMQVTYAEIKRVKGYGAIVAVPVKDGATCVGVISADGPGECFDKLDSEEIRLILRQTADYSMREFKDLSDLASARNAATIGS
jgi:hypothetical protein